MHITLQCPRLGQRILRPIGYLSKGSYMPPHPRTDKPLCIKPWSRWKLQLDTHRSCSCSELASVYLQVQIVYLLPLFVVAGCPGGRVPSHDLLGPLSVVIREVLLSMLRLAGDTCLCFRRTHHCQVEGAEFNR